MAVIAAKGITNCNCEVQSVVQASSQIHYPQGVWVHVVILSAYSPSQGSSLIFGRTLNNNGVLLSTPTEKRFAAIFQGFRRWYHDCVYVILYTLPSG